MGRAPPHKSSTNSLGVFSTELYGPLTFTARLFFQSPQNLSITTIPVPIAMAIPHRPHRRRETPAFATSLLTLHPVHRCDEDTTMSTAKMDEELDALFI